MALGGFHAHWTWSEVKGRNNKEMMQEKFPQRKDWRELNARQKEHVEIRMKCQDATNRGSYRKPQGRKTYVT